MRRRGGAAGAVQKAGWSPPTTPSAVYEAFAKGVERRSPETAELLRRCASDQLALAVIPENPTWDVPQRVLAAARWLVLAGEAENFEGASDPWASFRKILATRGEWVARFVREQRVQTNEVQRCFALLPLFLGLARAGGRRLDLIELGASAGLNLLWDRYRYRYSAGAWGTPDAPLELTGVDSPRVLRSLLQVRVDVRRRCGIDLNPIDVSGEAGLRLLLSFVRDGERRELLRRAAGVLHGDPPELLRGDYLELLPGLLESRSDDALTVVFQTLSTVYLSAEERARLRAILDAAGNDGPLGWISTPTPEEHGDHRGDYPLEVALWPGGRRQIVARMNVFGDRLEWVG